MSRRERIALWGIVGALFVWLLVLTVIAAGEFAAIGTALADRPGGEAREVALAGPTSWWDGGREADPPPEGEAGLRAGLPEDVRVGIASVQILSDTLAMRVTVRSNGAGDLLYEPPMMVDETGRVYLVTPDSLEMARLAFLDLVTRGQAEAQLVFAGIPPTGARLTLVFNSDQRPDDVLAPRVEVPVPLPMVEMEQ